MFSPCQAREGWGAEAAGDWGAEESWESVDENQGRFICSKPSVYVFCKVTLLDPFTLA